MKMTDLLKKRRTIYALNRETAIADEEIVSMIKELTELVPDAFNMKSSRVVIALGEKQDELWNKIYDAFDGNVPQEKIDAFKSARGTILYFYDEAVVRALQEQFPTYAENFPVWANQSSGMLQISVWTALAEQNIGANLQHYNPIIDETVREMFHLPKSYKLIAQMPFGNIVSDAAPKEKEDISKRVKLFK